MDWVSVVQTAVAVVGFGAVLYQLNQVEKSLRSSTRSSIYSLAASLKQTMINNPELRPYFYDEKKISEGDPNFDKVMLTADLFCLYLEKIATQGEGLSSINNKAWCNYIKGVYKTCPAIRSHLIDRESWYSDELWAIINK